jgi:hypothetical protein
MRRATAAGACKKGNTDYLTRRRQFLLPASPIFATVNYMLGTVMKQQNIFVLVITVFLLAGAAGCGMITPVGKIVPRGDRFEIGASKTYRVETNDLTASFETNRTGNTLRLEGSIRFADRIRNSFRTLEYFSMWIYFTGDTGEVLSAPRIWTSGRNQTMTDPQVQTQVEIPTGARALAFGYDGRAMESSKDMMISVDFRRLPLE